MGYISIKATKDKLINKDFSSYPFLLKQGSKDNMYLACKMKVCFASSSKFEEIKELIEKEILY